MSPVSCIVQSLVSRLIWQSLGRITWEKLWKLNGWSALLQLEGLKYYAFMFTILAWTIIHRNQANVMALCGMWHLQEWKRYCLFPMITMLLSCLYQVARKSFAQTKRLPVKHRVSNNSVNLWSQYNRHWPPVSFLDLCLHCEAFIDGSISLVDKCVLAKATNV